MLLEFEAGFARGVGEGFDLALVLEAATVEDDFGNGFGLGAVGHQFAHGLGVGHVGAGLGRFFLRAGRGEGHALGVVDDLRADVAAGEVDREARTLGGAGDFFADALVAEFEAVLACHGVYWTVLPSLRRTCSSA